MLEKVRMERPKCSVTIREFLRNSADLLNRVNGGESLLIIRRSVPVALLCPLPEEWYGAQPARRQQVTEPVPDSQGIETLAELEEPLEELAERILVLLLEGRASMDSIFKQVQAQAPLEAVSSQLGFLELERLVARRIGGYELSRLGFDVAATLKERNQQTT